MLYRDVTVVQFLTFCLTFKNIQTEDIGFVCPKDGRWPHPADCEKFYTCTGGAGVEAWCGNGMSYDVDHNRCDLSKNIDCKKGERPNWNPPSDEQTESIAERLLIKTTPSISNEKQEIENELQMAAKTTTVVANRLISNRKILPTIVLIENGACTFRGNMPDQENCQSYFTCKDDLIVRFQCPDKHLFDEDLRTCNDYRKVFCGNRPSNEHGNDPCVGQPNGWYADYGNQCRSYFLCADQRKTKLSDCPLGSKWNPHRLRCDDPRYIAAPCGYRNNHANSIIGQHVLDSYLTIAMTFSLYLFMF